VVNILYICKECQWSQEKRRQAQNFQKRMAKVLNNLNENRFDIVVKKFAGGSLAENNPW
jgi:hypothetical protein